MLSSSSHNNPSRVVITPEMEIAFQRIKRVHRQGPCQMAAVVGPSRAGKTTSMLLLADDLNTRCDANEPEACRAIYYVAADYKADRRATLERHVLAQVLSDGLDISVASDVRRLRPEDLRKKILLACRQRNIEIVFIDEAGQIPAEGLAALANLMNTAQVMFQRRLTIVLIGMDDLPLAIGEQPQVSKRVIDTIMFRPYGPAMAREILAQVEPFFDTLDLETEDGRRVMEFMTSKEVSDGGVLGMMIQLVRKTSEQCRDHGTEFSLRELRMAHLEAARDRNRAIDSAKNGWAPLPEPKDSKKTAQARAKEDQT